MIRRLLLVLTLGLFWATSLDTHAQDDCSILSARLIVGQMGRVTPGDANNMRDIPSTDGNRVGQVPGEAEFTVLAGPVCSNGFTWWEIDYDGLIGWTVEGIGDTYALEPIVPPTPTVMSSPTVAPTATPLPTTRLTADHVIWSGDGSTLAVSSTEGIWVYDTANWSAEPRLFYSRHWQELENRHAHLNLRNRIDPRMALNEDGSRLAMALCPSEGSFWFCVNGTIDIMNTETNSRIRRYNGQAQQIRGIAFLTDDRVVFGNEDTVTRIWSIANNSVPAVFDVPGEGLTLQGSIHGTHFGVVSEFIMGPGFWLQALEEEDRLRYGTSYDSSVIFSPDLRYMAWDTFYQNNGNLEIQEVLTEDFNYFEYIAFSERKVYEIPPVDLEGVAKVAQVYGFSHDNERLVIGYRAGAIRMWNFADMEEIYWMPNALNSPVISTAFSPDGAYFATVTDDYQVNIWDAATGERIVDL